MSFTCERIRALTEQDLADMLSLYGEYDPTTRVTHDDLYQAVTANAVFVARCENKIVGFVTVVLYRRLKGQVAQVEDVAVLQAFQRQGVGRLLLYEALEFAVNEGCMDIHLSTYPDMYPANALYRAMGGAKRQMLAYKWKLR